MYETKFPYRSTNQNDTIHKQQILQENKNQATVHFSTVKIRSLRFIKPIQQEGTVSS